VQPSASPTDAAISGAGFFVVNLQPDAGGEQLYTRAGSFTPDFLGNLRTASGQYLQGWALDDKEQIGDVNTLATVNVRGISGVASPTTTIELGANVDAEQIPFAGVYGAGSLARFAATGGTVGVEPHFTRAAQVYDSLGRSHSLTFSFLRTGAASNWAVEVHGAGNELDPASHTDGLIASGTVSFNGDGTLGAVNLAPVVAGATATSVGINWDPLSGANPSDVTLDLGTLGQTDGLSQFSSPTDVSFVRQNGAGVGELNGVSIDEEGYVTGTFSNGEQRRLYRLPIATFPSPGALSARSGNVYAQTDASGDVNMSVAGTGGAGTIAPSALEAANVDLADDFTRMIVTQRAYSANAKVITTTDEMLDEVIRIRC
jgi:flagellar hook protein FlgE